MTAAVLRRDAETDAPGRPRHPARRALGIAGDLLLSLLAALGVVCIAAVVAAYAFHLTLIMFKTGSMTPTIPTGSVALVREIPARDLAVGDVATVDRPGGLPVTHRVVSITPSADGTHTSLVLKGDANSTEDPSPYEVDHVRKVVWSAPGLGYLVARAQNPRVMSALTLAMAVLVTWAFWPRTRKELS